LLALKLLPSAGKALDILCIGAHCDDIEIGCGATILSLQAQNPRCRFHWFILTSTPQRRIEAMEAVEALVEAPARGEIRILALRDGFLPAHVAEVKDEFEQVKRSTNVDLILTHHGQDRHQDHELASRVTWQTFRDHMIWEYEIPKYDGDLLTPNLYVPLPSERVARKLEVITRAFRSQQTKSWFKRENLEALMRLRGLESRAPSGYSEAFHCRKLLCTFIDDASVQETASGSAGAQDC